MIKTPKRQPLRDAFLDRSHDRRIFTLRLFLLTAIILASFIMLIAHIYRLQITDHSQYITKSSRNRIRINILPPPRGLIYDRKGKLLAHNQAAIRISIIPEATDNLNQLLEKISSSVPLDSSVLKAFHERRKMIRGSEPVPLLYHITDQQLATLSVDLANLPGVVLEPHIIRHYPNKETMAHVIGYVSIPDATDLRQEPENLHYGSIGKQGIEKYYDKLLKGSVGMQQVEVDAHGRPARVLQETPPEAGADLHLTIDLDLQEAAVNAMGDYTGAAILLEPDSGNLLVFVSQPGFDPNLFSSGMKASQYRKLSSDPLHPLFNRALKGRYPPGSIIKPFMGLLLLSTPEIRGAMNPRGIYCPGYFRLPNYKRPYYDWKHQGHGWTTLNKAIEESCDVFFYSISLKLGIERISSFLNLFYLNQKTGVDLPGEVSGLIPSPEWKSRHMNESWFPGETVITAIGQGYMLTTPLQSAFATALLLSKGKGYQPHFLAKVDGARKTTSHHALPIQISSENKIPPWAWGQIQQAMVNVVHGKHGTARGLGKELDFMMGGKTGTAQVVALPQDDVKHPPTLEDHAWFIGFAPAQQPEAVVAILVEHGGSGSKVAAPIAGKILQAYMKQKNAS